MTSIRIFFPFIVVISLLMTSCDKDSDNGPISCAELVCQNGGDKVEYVDGTCGCDCEERFTGQDCGTDLCSGFNCENGFLFYSTSNNECGCSCNTGYSGPNCDQTESAQWYGTYTVNDNCVGQSYTITISAGDPPFGVVINNMGNAGTSLNIAGQAFSANNLDFNYNDGTFTFSGSFSQSSGVYTMRYNNGGDICEGSLLKQ